MYVTPRLLLQKKKLAPTLTAQGTWFHGDIQLVEIPEHRTHAIDGNHRNTMGIGKFCESIVDGLDFNGNLHMSTPHITTWWCKYMEKYIESLNTISKTRSLSVAVKHCRRASHPLLQHQTGTRRRCKSEVRKHGHCPSKLMPTAAVQLDDLMVEILRTWNVTGIKSHHEIVWLCSMFSFPKTVALQTETCKAICEAPGLFFIHVMVLHIVVANVVLP